VVLAVEGAVLRAARLLPAPVSLRAAKADSWGERAAAGADVADVADTADVAEGSLRFRDGGRIRRRLWQGRRTGVREERSAIFKSRLRVAERALRIHGWASRGCQDTPHG
jgi:hypothetical protein